MKIIDLIEEELDAKTLYKVAEYDNEGNLQLVALGNPKITLQDEAKDSNVTAFSVKNCVLKYALSYNVKDDRVSIQDRLLDVDKCDFSTSRTFFRNLMGKIRETDISETFWRALENKLKGTDMGF